MPPTHQPPVLVVMGVSGSGKSTLGAALAARLHWDFAEGDDFHPPENIAKMSAGVSLTDEDRWPWLDRIALWIRDHAESGSPGVITCSALKRSYRDRLRAEPAVFVHLSGTRDTIAQRLGARTSHFMPASLLESQFSALELADSDEKVFTVETSSTLDAAVSYVLEQLQLLGAEQRHPPAR